MAVSHQIVDVVAMYKPLTKWADVVITPESVPEMVRKAFDVAQSERPGATYLAIPEDVEAAQASGKPLRERPLRVAGADPAAVRTAAELIRKAKRPIILAGHGVARARASKELTLFSEVTGIPVATTYVHGQGSDLRPAPQCARRRGVYAPRPGEFRVRQVGPDHRGGL